MAQLNGRVFTRLQQYDALPAEFKNEVEALEQYLTSSQGDIFGSHRTMQLKSVYGVRTRALLEMIEAWVKQHGQSATASTSHTTQTTDATTDATTSTAKSNVGNYQVAGSATPAIAQVPPVGTPAYSDPSVGAHIPQAKKLLDALVLKGFVTPHKEDKPDDLPSATEDLEFKDNELLVARAKDVAASKDAKPTVWDLVDGAVFAGMLQRKTGLIESLTHGKDAYAIVNMRLKNLTLFSSDVGREPIAQFDATSLRVSFDKSHHEFGVKVYNDSDSEFLNAATQHESDALMQALLAVGASHRDNDGHGHGAATTAEKLRHEVKDHVGGDEDKHVVSSDSKAPVGGNATRTTAHASGTEQDQHRGWDTDKTNKEHAGTTLNDPPTFFTLHTQQLNNTPTTATMPAHEQSLSTENTKGVHDATRGHVNEPTMAP